MTNINKIYHISDIHIKNNSSFIDEYLYVFNNLYKYLEEVKDDNSLIVITGDILHVPNNITPETEILCVNFFSKLSNIMTTIIIAGNHDIHVNSDIIIDSLQSILLLRDNELKNLHYLRKSGIYKFGNINFGVNSLIDNKKITANEILDEGIKICLYHGSIANSKNSNGFEFSGKSITQFDGYDYVLLGDIHNYQYLNDKKTIAYASSLISQTMGECDDYHGVLVWDLKNKTSEYKIIENKYRNIQLDLEDDIINIDI
jgi:DNA repair exonuclease SbcCD nuclease subunit